MPDAAAQCRARASPRATRLQPRSLRWSVSCAALIPADCVLQALPDLRFSCRDLGRIFYQLAVAKKDEPGRVSLSQRTLMGNHQHGCSLAVNGVNKFHDLASSAAVEIASRFIGKQ